MEFERPFKFPLMPAPGFRIVTGHATQGDAMPEERIEMTVNGDKVAVTFGTHKTLLEVLRENLNLTGTKHGCELGECGACAVLVDGKPVLSCLMLAVEADGAKVTTVEGLADEARLHPLQEAFADCGAAQCGYCTPGFLVTAKALLDAKPKATRKEICEGLAGNLCRCTGYIQIFEAVETAAARMAKEGRPAIAPVEIRRAEGGK